MAAEKLVNVIAAPGRWIILGILAAALLLRLAAAAVPSMAHPDEVFQYLEQAHRLAFGYGVTPWEYRVGMRSWLLPLALSPLMSLGELLAPGTQLYLFLPKLLPIALSLLIPASAYGLGARISRTHGLVALLVAAFWHELVYYGAHVLTEAVATAVIIAGAAILTSEERHTRRVVLAGFLMALGGLLRFHYLPALGVFTLLSAGKDFRGTWMPLLAGGLAALAAGAAVDIAMGEWPFAWLIENFRQNILLNKSANFGVSGPLEYVSLYLRAWGWTLLPLLLFMLPAIQRYRPLFWMAVANLAVHSMIGHKEYRFVLLTTAIFVILAAIGSVEWMRRIEERLPKARLAPILLILLWGGMSASLALAEPMRGRWLAFSSGFESAGRLGRAPGLCGVALYDLPFWEAGGYVHLRRAVPLYLMQTPGISATNRDLAGAASAFNGIIAPEDRASELAPRYRKLSCSSVEREGRGTAFDFGTHRVCSFIRQGGCDPAAAPGQRLDRVMRDEGL